MKSNPKKPSLYPSQFIENLLKYHDTLDTNPININIRKFQQTIDELKSTYEVHFDYLELVDYAKRFNRPFIMIEELEINLNPSGFEIMKEHLAWYNRMYKLNDKTMSGNVSNIWKKLK